MMSRGQKIFWSLSGALAVVILGGGVLLAAPVALGAVDTGLATVRVHEKTEGFRLYLPVPAVLLDAGLRTAALAGAFEDIGPLPPEFETWSPVARAALEALMEADDAVLVEVESRDEHVRIEKRGSRFLIQVRSADADVDVSVPVRLALRAFDLLEQAART